MTCAPKVVADVLPALEAVLPANLPGLSAREIHAAVPAAAIYSPNTIRIALGTLERDGRAVSDMRPGLRNQMTRFYRRAAAGEGAQP